MNRARRGRDVVLPPHLECVLAYIALFQLVFEEPGAPVKDRPSSPVPVLYAEVPPVAILVVCEKTDEGNEYKT